MSFADYDPANPLDALRTIGTIQPLYPDPNSPLVAAGIKQLAGEDLDVNVYPRTALYPPFVLAQQEGTVFVASSGVNTLAHGLALFAAASLEQVPVGSGKANQLVLSAAKRIRDAVVSRYGPAARDFILAGHSYGGAIVEVLWLLLSRANLLSNAKLCTFGAPRPGDAELALALPTLWNRRWMMADDPIPFFPPNWREAPGATALLPPLLLANYQLYAQGPGGTVLFNNGTLRKGQLPPSKCPDIALPLIEWVAGAQWFGGAAHADQHYVSALQYAVPAGGQPTPAPPPPSPPEVPQKLSFIELKEASATGPAPVPSPVASEVKPMALIPPLYRAKFQKVGATWSVIWMEHVVAACHKRTTARTIAKYLNSFLRRQLSAASVSSDDWNKAWLDYFSVCGRADLGFNPPLVIT